jgi:GNAT superfamily N-acetyltransferase
MLEVKRKKLYLDGVHIGFFEQCRTEDVNLSAILDMFSDDCKVVLKTAPLPRRFHYTWISDIAIKPKWRRQGIASEVMAMIATPNTLVACAPGSGSAGRMRMNHEDRLAFYRKIGFTLVVGTKHDYAFKFYGKKED